jgi:hypothetical protein
MTSVIYERAPLRLRFSYKSREGASSCEVGFTDKRYSPDPLQEWHLIRSFIPNDKPFWQFVRDDAALERVAFFEIGLGYYTPGAGIPLRKWLSDLAERIA